MKTQSKLVLLATLLFAAVQSWAVSTTYIVKGTADPWLANATIDNVGTPESPDTAPDQSPVDAGSFSPGDVISWTATGSVGHPGDISGPDGNAGVIVSRFIGANNGIADITSPINALIGVWEIAGGGIPFIMGASGSATAPAGTTGLFLGVMDGYGWANNVGEFTVVLHRVPEAGSTLVLLTLALVGLTSSRRRVT